MLLIFNTDLQAQFKTNAWYRLHTQWQGACKSLDVINDGTNNRITLANTDELSGQLWKITPIGRTGYYRLTTMWQGTGKSLDIRNDRRKNTPVLSKTGRYSGQQWKLTPIGSTGYYRLTTRWRGSRYSLDVRNDGQNNSPILARTGNYAGQHWKITEEHSVTTPPAGLGLHPFYKKYLNGDGIPIVSSENTSDEALIKVKFMARRMLSRMPHVRAEMIRRNTKIAIIAKSENATDIPEHAFLKYNTEFDADARARGYGGTVEVPTNSCAEENILCLSPDRYYNEDIFIHEFAHSIHKLGLDFADPTFPASLRNAYQNAKSNGLWINTYAMTDETEYFAEIVQCWFDTNAEAIPTDSVHNHVNTRDELKAYDITGYRLLEKYFPADRNRCSCH